MQNSGKKDARDSEKSEHLIEVVDTQSMFESTEIKQKLPESPQKQSLPASPQKQSEMPPML